MHNFDYYEFLGLQPNASADEIKKAFRKKSFDCHPDHGGSNELMRKLLLAYDVLSNPSKRQSYDASHSYFKHKKQEKRQYQKTERSTSDEQKEDDYSKAIFVNGIEAEDSSGVISYHRLHSYIYYPIKVKKKFMFWEYESYEYYRANIKKIFSRKRNSFNHIPLFIVEIEDFEQMVFLKDYKRHWLSQDGYDARERKKALITLFTWSVATLALLLLLFIPQIISSNPSTYTENTTTDSSSVNDCDIKGNISFSTGEKIYHMPGDKYYQSTAINSDYGERWFCSEQDAQEAGWRKSYE